MINEKLDEKYSIYGKLLDCRHLYIGGGFCSGKSTLLSNLIYASCFRNEIPTLFLFNTRRVPLYFFEDMKNIGETIEEPKDSLRLLRQLYDIADNRCKIAADKNLKMCDLPDIYVFFDDVSDITLEHKNEANVLLYQIATRGKIAKIHLIMSTIQSLNIDMVDPAVLCCVDCFVALRMNNEKLSKRVINIGGAENLSGPGSGIINYSGKITSIKFPMIDDNELRRVIKIFSK